MSTIDIAALRLYRARHRHHVAKAMLRGYREEHGGCATGGILRGTTEESWPPCWHDSHMIYPYPHIMPYEEWCGVCKGSQPLWQAYREAAKERGAALRGLMHEVRRTLPQEEK